jgi:Fur family transcriptional regulator, ferric uptake regulator
MPDVTIDDWIEHAQDRLARSGYRRGGARRAVIELLGRQKCALTAHEIDERLRVEGRAVGRASVYRALEQLTDLHLVTRLEVGQDAARYEPVHPGGEHHHHLVCDRCGRITPFEDRALETAIDRVSRRVRFDVGDHDVVLHGACERCRR